MPAVLPHVIVSAAGSTSLKVEWTALPPDQARGIVTRHRLIYRQHDSPTQSTVDLLGDVHEYIINGMTVTLTSFGVYENCVQNGCIFGWVCPIQGPGL